MDSPEAPAPVTVRRYDLDWVRVLAFWLLIVFHVAIAFVPWRVYAYSNNQMAGEWLEFVLQFLHQWRLPVLFLISGMGTSFAFRRRTGWVFVGERSKRLLVPLLFGMLVVNLPIAFYAVRSPRRLWTELGFGELVEFVREYWFGFEWLGLAAHLWFLVNLFVFSLLLAPVFVYLRRRPDGRLLSTARRVAGMGEGMGLLLMMPAPLIVVELLIKPWLPGVVGQGYEFFWYLGLFFLGYILIQVGDQFWEALARLRFKALGLGVGATVILFALTARADSVATLYGIAVLNGGWTEYGFAFWGPITFPAAVLHSLNTWAWCMTVFAWAAKYLSKPSERLTYFNQSVYPFYIVHQTIILVVLWYVRLWNLWWPIKLLLLTVATFVGCWATFEIVKRTKLTRVLFGIKPRPPADQSDQELAVRQ